MGIPFMVRDSLFLYININYKVMSSFTPVWHPSEATNSFRLYNNIANEEDYDGSLYYDTDSNYIDIPKIFNYKKIDNSNYTVAKVLTNSASDDPIFNPSLPSTEGTFTINKLIADEEEPTPTIDIYCGGNIKINRYYYPTFSGWPDELKNVVNAYRSGWNFNVNNAYFPSNENINVSWSHNGSYSITPASYNYNGSKYTFYIAGDYISVTTNWNNNRISSQNASSSGTLPGCNNYEGNNGAIPEITCRWELIMGFNREDIPQQYDEWTGRVINMGSDQLAIRSDPSIPSNYYDNIVGWLTSGQIVTVSGDNGGWYYIGSGWVSGNYIERI